MTEMMGNIFFAMPITRKNGLKLAQTRKVATLGSENCSNLKVGLWCFFLLFFTDGYPWTRVMIDFEL